MLAKGYAQLRKLFTVIEPGAGVRVRASPFMTILSSNLSSETGTHFRDATAGSLPNSSMFR